VTKLNDRNLLGALRPAVQHDALGSGQPAALLPDEHRETERLLLTLRVHVLLPGGHHEMRLSYDWSSRGVFLRTCNPPEVGTPLELFVVVGVPARKMTLRGRVARVRWGADPVRELPPGAGVELDEVPASLPRLLEEAAARSNSRDKGMPRGAC
jgi:hypothetical protein